ncbi:MAG: PilZ domain-containing protein [Planctomycetota bacterium]|nr:PilZ domain-containing protein [Planctomycetota bacterium]
MSTNKNQFIEDKLLQSLETRRSKNDKRMAVRTEVRLAIQIRLMGRTEFGPWEKAQLRDISARGCSIAMKQELRAADCFLAQLPGATQNAGPAALICRVVHCRPQGDGTFLIGSEFSGKMPSLKESVPAPAESTVEQERIRRSILL